MKGRAVAGLCAALVLPACCVLSPDFGGFRAFGLVLRTWFFCNDFALSLPMNGARPWAMLASWDDQRDEMPVVPNEYRPFLPERPLRGTVRIVRSTSEDGGLTRVEARVDIGSRAGLLPGMVLFFDDEPELRGVVVATGASSGSVELRARPASLAVQPGSTASTRHPRSGEPAWYEMLRDNRDDR